MAERSLIDSIRLASAQISSQEAARQYFSDLAASRRLAAFVQCAADESCDSRPLSGRGRSLTAAVIDLAKRVVRAVGVFR